MSGKRITKAERRMVIGQRRYAKRIRENERELFGGTTESDKTVRAFARIGK